MRAFQPSSAASRPDDLPPSARIASIAPAGPSLIAMKAESASAWPAVSAGAWAKLNEADRKIFEDVTREAGARATKAIVDNENRLVSGFEKMGKTVVKVDRRPFQAAVAKELTAPNLPWSKDVFDRVQAIR